MYIVRKRNISNRLADLFGNCNDYHKNYNDEVDLFKKVKNAFQSQPRQRLIDLVDKVEKKSCGITKHTIIAHTEKKKIDTSWSIFYENYVCVDGHFYPIQKCYSENVDLCRSYGKYRKCDYCEEPFEVEIKKEKYIVIDGDVYYIKKNSWGKRYLSKG